MAWRCGVVLWGGVVAGGGGEGGGGGGGGGGGMGGGAVGSGRELLGFGERRLASCCLWVVCGVW